MQTYLTTYSTTEDNASKEQGGYLFSEEENISATYGGVDSDGNYSVINQSLKNLGFSGYTLASGTSSAYNAMTGLVSTIDYVRSHSSEGGETMHLISTYRSPPYSIYTGKSYYYYISQTYGYSSIAGGEIVPCSLYKGSSTLATISFEHYGGTISKFGSGLTGKLNETIEYNDESWANNAAFIISGTMGVFTPTLPFFDELTTFTAPIFDTKVASLTIVTTTNVNSFITFLSTQVSYNIISSTTSAKTYQYSSTKSVTTDYNHYIGTAFGFNNSYFTQISESDTDSNGISPYSAVFIPPSGSVPFFGVSLISESSTHIFQSTSPRFVQRQLFTASSFPPTYGTPIIYTYITTTLFSYSSTDTQTTESTKPYTYIFNGINGNWYSTSADGTTMTTIAEVSMTEFSSLSNLGYESLVISGGIPDFSSISPYPTTYYTSYDRGGVLNGYGTTSSNSSIDIKTQEMIHSTISTRSCIFYFEKDYSISSSLTTTNSTIFQDPGGADVTASLTQRSASFSFTEIKTTYLANENFFTPVYVQPTLYKPEVFNQELNAMGHLYVSNDSEQRRYFSFSEIPAIFLYSNRITYNASKFIPNHGMFSSINQSQEELFKFPAIGIGKTFTEYAPIYSDTNQSSSYTFSLRALHRQPINNKVDVEFYINYNTAIPSAKQKWALRKDGTNHKYFQYPTGASGSVTTYETFQTFTAIPMNYVAEENTSSEFINKEIIIIEKNSARIKEYVTFNSGVVIASSNFATSLTQSYYVTDSDGTSIANFGDAMRSALKFSIIKPVITASKCSSINNCLFGGRFPNQGFGMLNSTHFLNFTNHNGSTYIDV